MAFQWLKSVRAKIVIDGKIIEHISELSYIEYHFGYRRYEDVEIKMVWDNFVGQYRGILKY